MGFLVIRGAETIGIDGWYAVSGIILFSQCPVKKIPHEAKGFAPV